MLLMISTSNQEVSLRLHEPPSHVQLAKSASNYWFDTSLPKSRSSIPSGSSESSMSAHLHQLAPLIHSCVSKHWKNTSCLASGTHQGVHRPVFRILFHSHGPWALEGRQHARKMNCHWQVLARRCPTSASSHACPTPQAAVWSSYC